MARASVEKPFLLSNHPDVSAGIVKWPMSVIRLSSYNRASLSAACAEVLKKWRAYTDEQAGIFAQTDGIPHNTITPIARMNGSQYECDLVLRNNITSEDRPLGIFHPAPALHHIKKENIGLIEVMGLAVLPARLATELSILRDAMLSGADMTSVSPPTPTGLRRSSRHTPNSTPTTQWTSFTPRSERYSARSLRTQVCSNAPKAARKHLSASFPRSDKYCRTPPGTG